MVVLGFDWWFWCCLWWAAWFLLVLNHQQREPSQNLKEYPVRFSMVLLIVTGLVTTLPLFLLGLLIGYLAK